MLNYGISMFMHELLHNYIPRLSTHLHFLPSCSVVVTEGRPDGTGLRMARALDELGIPTTMVLDSGVAYTLEK